MLALVTTPAPEAAPVPTAAPIPAPAAAPETAETEAPAAPAAPAPEDPAAAEQAAPAAEDAATAPAGPAAESEPQYVQVAGAAAPASTSFSEAAETEFVALTNQARAAVGAPGVARSATLDGYARAHAAAMVEAGQIHHSDIASLLGPFSTVGENVGVGPAVGDIQAALTQSPTHYSNMVEPGFTSVGVGTLVDGAGMIWTVHVYGARSAPRFRWRPAEASG
jgi:uncharacterized protein YkwD